MSSYPIFNRYRLRRLPLRCYKVMVESQRFYAGGFLLVAASRPKQTERLAEAWLPSEFPKGDIESGDVQIGGAKLEPAERFSGEPRVVKFYEFWY